MDRDHTAIEHQKRDHLAPALAAAAKFVQPQLGDTAAPDIFNETDAPETIYGIAAPELLRLLGDKAAVDYQLRAGDKRRFIRCKEQHAVSYLDRLADLRSGVVAILSARSPALVAFNIGGISRDAPCLRGPHWAVSDRRGFE